MLALVGGSMNPLNLTILVLDFIPKDLKWRRRRDLEWQLEGPRMAAGGITNVSAIGGPYRPHRSP